MIIKFNERELKTKIGYNLLHDVFVEEIIVINYRYKRKEGIDYTSLLVDEFLKHSFDVTKTEVNVNSLLSKDKIISATYGVLDRLTVLLLMEIKDIKFKDILFKGKENNSYVFEVIY